MIWLIEICHTDYLECSLVDFVLESTEATDYQVFTWEVRRHTHIMHLQNYWQVGKINFHFCTHLTKVTKVEQPYCRLWTGSPTDMNTKSVEMLRDFGLKFLVLPFSELLLKERNSKGIFLCLLNKKLFGDEVVVVLDNSSLESSSSLTNTVLIPISSPT